MDSKPLLSGPNFSSHDVENLLERVATQGKSLLQDNGDLSLREELLASARSLCNALETPMESILRQGWANVSSKLPVHFKSFQFLKL
jgi:hypothetical protein